MVDNTFSPRLTPATIARTNSIYFIPIYQRLFEWDEPRILQLLDDLTHSFKKDVNSQYYIGMLTSNEKNELIDGQQRFTVIMLIGICLYQYANCWCDFLLTKENRMRLSFSARNDDNIYMDALYKQKETNYVNINMKRGLDCIEQYVLNNFKSDSERESFAKYVFEHLSVFISRLPKQYNAKSLNKYFETMNSTGKNLENHEILKVNLLKDAHDKVRLTKIWNAVSDMDQHLIRRRKGESIECLINRYRYALNAISRNDMDELFEGNYINDLKNTENKEGKYKSIGEIRAFSERPERQRLSRGNGFHSILSFTEFLLQILWINISDKYDKIPTEEFF